MVFFIDMLGHASDPHIAESIATLRERAASLRVMGSYPRDVRIPKRTQTEV
jgi:prephenate dehydratase